MGGGDNGAWWWAAMSSSYKLHKCYRAVTDQKSPTCTAFAHEGQAALWIATTVWVVTLPVCLANSTVQCNVY